MNGLVPMLMCQDVQASIDFYTQVLGFEVEGRMDSIGKSGWASLHNGPARIMLASPSYIPQGKKMRVGLPNVPITITSKI
tara:strand:- start:223 stop:462 length:240 start_codon:yes stop_codon:yes gene_type:complete